MKQSGRSRAYIYMALPLRRTPRSRPRKTRTRPSDTVTLELRISIAWKSRITRERNAVTTPSDAAEEKSVRAERHRPN
jgi:hypothetical protein